MQVLTKSVVCVMLLSLLFSCNKDPQLSPREQQELEEQTGPLLANEILEQEGVRFILNYTQEDADIDLKLYKGTGTTLVPLEMFQEQPFVNYSVLASQMAENSDYTIQVELPSVVKNGTFDLTVIGYTNLNSSKRFTVPSVPFTVANQGAKRNFLKIHKGLRKYSFYTY